MYSINLIFLTIAFQAMVGINSSYLGINCTNGSRINSLCSSTQNKDRYSDKMYDIRSISNTNKPYPSQRTRLNDTINLNDSLVFDKTMVRGKLNNDLTYYIKKNGSPEKRLIIRMLFDVGDIDEEDHQKGYAHFIEHLAFNGTNSYPGAYVVNFFRSVGCRLGRDLRAGTGVDDTVFEFQIPTSPDSTVERTFSICSDMAFNLSLSQAEIDKERGVILEELRLGQGATRRMLDKLTPVIYGNSKYANTTEVGTSETIQKANRQDLLSFYKDWYRPDLMKLIIVGDMEPKKVELLIEKYFDRFPKTESPRVKKYFEVPDQQGTAIGIAKDKEASHVEIELIHYRPVTNIKTIGEYREELVASFHNEALNCRLKEISHKSETPYTFSIAYNSELVKTKDEYRVYIVSKPGKVAASVDFLLEELERVKRFGFTEYEYEIYKRKMNRFTEFRYANRFTRSSSEIVLELIHNLKKDNVIVSEEDIYNYNKELLPQITMKELHDYAISRIVDTNRALIIKMPDDPTVASVDENELRNILANIKSRDIQPYEVDYSNSPILSNLPNGGKIVRTEEYRDVGITKFILSNGASVIIKPTAFEKNVILFKAIGLGGASLLPEKDYFMAKAVEEVFSKSGVGELDLSSLNRMLSGKFAIVAPYINLYDQGMKGYTTPDDIEVFFQLIHANFAYPRKDQEVFMSYKSNVELETNTNSKSPFDIGNDTLKKMLYNGHYSYRLITPKDIDNMSLDRMMEIYQDRFRNASDFTFIFVGDIDIEKFATLSEKYLASLPFTSKKESWKDIGFRYPKGVVKKELNVGSHDQSMVYITYTGGFNFSLKNQIKLKLLSDLLREELRLTVREESGGSYNVNCTSEANDKPYPYYKIDIRFGCSPQRVDELISLVMNTIGKIKADGPNPVSLTSAKETLSREYMVNLQKNSQWIDEISQSVLFSRNPNSIAKVQKYIQSIKPKEIQDICTKYFDFNNYLQVVLKPESI